MPGPRGSSVAVGVVGACGLALAGAMWIWHHARGSDEGSSSDADDQQNHQQGPGAPAAEVSAVFADATSDNDDTAGSISCSRADSYHSAASTEGLEVSSAAPPPGAERSSAGGGGPGPRHTGEQAQPQDTEKADSSTHVQGLLKQQQQQQQQQQQEAVSLLDALGIPSPVAAGSLPPVPPASSSSGGAEHHAMDTPAAEGSRGGGSPLPGPPGAGPSRSPPPPAASVTLGDWPSMGLPAQEGSSSGDGGAAEASPAQQDAVPLDSASASHAPSAAAAAATAAAAGVPGALHGSNSALRTSPPPAYVEQTPDAPSSTALIGPSEQGAAETSSSPQVMSSWGLLLEVPAVAGATPTNSSSSTPAATAQLGGGESAGSSQQQQQKQPAHVQGDTPSSTPPAQRPSPPGPSAAMAAAARGGWWAAQQGGTWGSGSLAAAAASGGGPGAGAGRGEAGVAQPHHPSAVATTPSSSSSSGWTGPASISGRLGRRSSGGGDTGPSPGSQAGGSSSSAASSQAQPAGSTQVPRGGARSAGGAAAAAGPPGGGGGPWLQVQLVRGPAAGAQHLHQAAAGQLVVGRSPECGLPIPDQEVSSCHATIAWSTTSAAWVLVDCGSLNGTWVNGAAVSRPGRQRSDPIPLRDGDEVRLGATTTLLVRLGHAAATATTSSNSSVEPGSHPDGGQAAAHGPVTPGLEIIACSPGPLSAASSPSSAGGSPGRDMRPATWHGSPRRRGGAGQGPYHPAAGQGGDAAGPGRQHQQHHPQQQQQAPGEGQHSPPSGHTSSSSSRGPSGGGGPRGPYSSLHLDRSRLATSSSNALLGGGGGGEGEAGAPSPLAAPLTLAWPAGRVTAALQRKVGADHRRQQVGSQDVAAWAAPLEGQPQCALFCLFDGHQGVAAAQQAAVLLPHHVVEQLCKAADNTTTTSSSSSSSSSRSPSEAPCTNTCDNTPAHTAQAAPSNGHPPPAPPTSPAAGPRPLLTGVSSHAAAAAAWEAAFLATDGALAGEDGCTATLVLLEAGPGGRVALQCANVGDSAALLVDMASGEWSLLTEDHRIASNPAEAARLAARSSRHYGLNIGRMLGDRFLKEQGVGFSAAPGVSPLRLVAPGQEAALVVASDGLWDVVGPGRAASLVARAGGGPGAAADALMAAALAQRSKDDISIMVVHIAALADQGAPAAPAAGPAAAAAAAAGDAAPPP